MATFTRETGTVRQKNLNSEARVQTPTKQEKVDQFLNIFFPATPLPFRPPPPPPPSNGLCRSAPPQDPIRCVPRREPAARPPPLQSPHRWASWRYATCVSCFLVLYKRLPWLCFFDPGDTESILIVGTAFCLRLWTPAEAEPPPVCPVKLASSSSCSTVPTHKMLLLLSPQW